ncbi:MAG: diguanylate cyclase [Candidatus Omnitrophica bacterium]|nr:diguanylate cyclase [Candidatus Omnitrophota bacterium]
MSNEPVESRILALADNITAKNFLKNLLEGEGYAFTGRDDPKNITDDLIKNKIELLIIDFETANIVETCKKIRTNFALRHIPIIVLVSKVHTIQRIKCIYAGADDYVEKPIEAGELLTRIKANLWRANRDLDANPLTHLPGNVTILKELDEKLKNKEVFCVGYADLDKFKEYNDYYGFEWGDKVIQYTASVISDSIIELGTPGDFLGHIGGDDFLFITNWESVKAISEKVIAVFDKNINAFYKDDDLKKGYIIVKNREGKVTATSILSISIGIATNKFRKFTHVGQIIQTATELKGYAKTFSKSIYTIDKRI